MNYKLTKGKFYSFMFLLLYKILLDFTYVEFVHKLFNYTGFILNFSLHKYILGLIYFVIIYIFLPNRGEKPSSIFLQIHFIIMIIPMFTIYSFSDRSNLFMFLVFMIFILECVVLSKAKLIRIVRIKNSKRILKFIIIGLSLTVYISMIKANGLPSLKALNILEVYEIRSTVEYPFLMPYLVNWQAKIINPFLITIAYVNKNKKMMIFAIFMQIMIYLITAHKSYLLIPTAIILIIKMVEKGKFIKSISVLAPLGILASYLVYKIFKNIIVASLFIRRLLMVPAKLKFDYYEFFSNNKFEYFAQGFIGKILNIKSNYDMSIPNLIGKNYYNNVNTAANTGYLADAYANLGIIGMFTISFLFVTTLIIMDSLAKNIDKKIVVGLSIFSILSLNDAAFLTTLLTGGLMLLIVVLYLYSIENDTFLK